MKLYKKVQKSANKAKRSVKGAHKAAIAGAAGATLFIGNAIGAIRDKAAGVGRAITKNSRCSEEGIFVKKSTFVTILVALAAVAGVLGALYVYVLRREKELDEYEQLLFSEDFNDEIPYDNEEDTALEADATEA